MAVPTVTKLFALFVSKRYDGVHAHGASRGKIRGEERDGQKERGHPQERNAIDPTQSIKNSSKQVRSPDGKKHSNQQTGEHGAHPLKKHQSHNVSLVGAE